jgi:hypothetical protein
MGDALKRMSIATVAAVVGLGAVAALFAWASGHTVSGSIAALYYIVGAALFLIGMFPTGGYSIIRGGARTRRRPVGSRQEPIFLLGIVLVGLGVVADVVRPF